jgi:hypothetical protein
MEQLEHRLKDIYGERRWIVAIGAAAGAVSMCQTLKEWGCDTLVVAAVDGVGELPDTEIAYTHARGETIVDGIRAFFDSVERPNDEVMQAVNAFDPEGAVAVIAEPYATAAVMVGRPTFGVRRPQWSAWEDKMRVDELWRSLGIPHAPYRIVKVADAPSAADDLATDLGTVWVADNSRGWHGGADFVRWVRNSTQHAAEVEWFSQHADVVRIMPFLDGLPCSIHGWVTGTGVAVFLPVEILVLRRTDQAGFGYAGVATTWEADDDITREMRSIATKVGTILAERDGYIGPFGVDGILTAEGFRPTELNPRMSVGAGVQLRDAEVPLGLVMRAEIEGLVDVDHRWLEDMALANRKPYLHFGKPLREGSNDSVLVGRHGGRLAKVSDKEGSVGRLTLGPSNNGMYLRGEFEVDAIPQGQPAGPLVAEAINLASSQWGLGLPRYAAAQLPD